VEKNRLIAEEKAINDLLNKGLTVDDINKPKPKEFKCSIDGQVFGSQLELDSHIAANHRTTIDPEEAARIAKAQNELLEKLYQEHLERLGNMRIADLNAEETRYQKELAEAKGNAELIEAVEEAHLARITAINKKYNDEEAKAAQEAAEAKLEAEKKLQEEKEAAYQKMKRQYEFELAAGELTLGEQYLALEELKKYATTQEEIYEIELKILEIKKKATEEMSKQNNFLTRITGTAGFTPEQQQRYESGLDVKTGEVLNFLDQFGRAGELLVGKIVQQAGVIGQVIMAITSGNWVGVLVSLISETESYKGLIQVFGGILRPFIDLLDLLLMPILKGIVGLWNGIITTLKNINIGGWKPFAGFGKYLISLDEDGEPEQSEFDRRMQLFNHKVAMDQITKEQQIAELERIKEFAKTKAEVWQIEERIHQLQKDIAEGGGVNGEAPKPAGVEISEITGPTRDILVSLLSPLANLTPYFVESTDYLKQIRDAIMEQVRMATQGPAFAGAGNVGTGGYGINIGQLIWQINDSTVFQSGMDFISFIYKGSVIGETGGGDGTSEEV
jgi:hypothetical protein